MSDDAPATVTQRLVALRGLMERERLTAYLVPSTDPHNDEYVPECWQRRRWLSGFTGSAGDVLVTADGAYLWTDSRYHIQAERELAGSTISLFKHGLEGVPSLEEWLKRNLGPDDVLGVDPRVLSCSRAAELERALSERGARLAYVEANLVDAIWTDRPAPSADPVRVLDDRFTGESVRSKLARLRERMREAGCDAHILCALDDIAWLTNLRGSDVAYNPIFIAYAIVGLEGARLFVDPAKAGPEVRAHLDGVAEIVPYQRVREAIVDLARTSDRVWIDPDTTNQWVVTLLQGRCRLHKERSPVTDFKSVKNDTELEGFRRAMVRDGVAMVRFLKWLSEEVPKGGVTELSAARRLDSLREQGESYVEPSFETISAYGPHGAVVHYAVDPSTDLPLEPRGLYLVDSGGQYLDGTTDVTRTVALGPVGDAEREMFTRVLRGHIGLATLVFPKGWSGKQLELPARRPLWEAGRNYGHGTGHGIGHFLCVHEGPMGITPRDKGVPLAEGNVLSNEPGYYEEGAFGIRIENVVAVRRDETLSREGSVFLRFETLTLCPIDRSLVNPSLMTRDELDWLDAYHQRVFNLLAPHLDDDERSFLREATAPIAR